MTRHSLAVLVVVVTTHGRGQSNRGGGNIYWLTPQIWTALARLPPTLHVGE